MTWTRCLMNSRKPLGECKPKKYHIETSEEENNCE